ncbi:MAG: anhydro-N-acetylmuramic acid kinase [Deltaproteobacteria bacterium]|nr:anhydro-N-acetylmuramic acid kinase [Deltaproteobacteria bacterium]
MSGTSLDGLDIALVAIAGSGSATKISLEAFASPPYSAEWQHCLQHCTNPMEVSAIELGQLHVGLGSHWAEIVLQQLHEWHIDLQSIDAVASHGQTVLHLPPESTLRAYLPKSFPNQFSATWQLGDADQLAQSIGLPVVSDFRMKDLAGGGTGAPLLPYLDFLLFNKIGVERILHNLGGISNLTFLPGSDNSEEVLAFDTGPANLLLNIGMQHSGTGELYDKDGQTAAKGKANNILLNQWLRHPYLDFKPPKSTGREEFGSELMRTWLNEAKSAGLSLPDLMATLTAFTAESINRAYRDHLPSLPIESFLSGGGSFNKALRKQIERRLPEIHFRDFSELGQPAEAREAIGFSVLGNQFLMGESTTFPSITGNQLSVILGKLSLPN